VGSDRQNTYMSSYVRPEGICPAHEESGMDVAPRMPSPRKPTIDMTASEGNRPTLRTCLVPAVDGSFISWTDIRVCTACDAALFGTRSRLSHLCEVFLARVKSAGTMLCSSTLATNPAALLVLEILQFITISMCNLAREFCNVWLAIAPTGKPISLAPDKYQISLFDMGIY
jgi:hypothetical protein